jgi:hypothetical protein
MYVCIYVYTQVQYTQYTLNILIHSFLSWLHLQYVESQIYI